MGIIMRIFNKLRQVVLELETHEIAARKKAVGLIAEEAGNLNSKLIFTSSMSGGQGVKALGVPCFTLKTEEA